MTNEPASLPQELLRAARLSAIPGVTLDEACRRYGIKKSALLRARKTLGRSQLQPSTDDLLLAALSNNGSATQGQLPEDLGGIASWIDHINHDGCDANEIRRLLASLAARGMLAIAGTRWKLLKPWP
jgi:transposase-like protein